MEAASAWAVAVVMALAAVAGLVAAWRMATAPETERALGLLSAALLVVWLGVLLALVVSASVP